MLARTLPRAAVVALLSIPLLPSIARAQTAEPAGPKAPSDDDKIPKGGVISGTSEGGTPTGSSAGDESGKAGAPATTVVVTDTTKTTDTAQPTAINEAPNTVNPEAVVRPTSTGNFMDTRLTWTFGDDDILHRTGTTQPLSPLPSIGDRPGYRLFFDNLNSRFSGRENLAHLVLYKKMPAFIENLDTEAALVLRFDMQSLAAQNGNVNQALYDAGSYLRLFYNMGKDKSGNSKGVGLTFFPLDTDRFRLGYLYDISWGGTNVAINQSIFPRLVGASPGAKLQFDLGDGIYFFGGFKTASIVQPQTNLRPGTNTGNEVEVVRVTETNYGFLGGLGADLGPLFHIDGGAGYFQQGRFDLPDLLPPPGSDRQSPRVFTYGYSGRLVFHQGMATPQSIDFLLYRNDPNAPMMMFKPEVYKAREIGYSAAFEITQIKQNLHDPDPNKTGATKIQTGNAMALNGVLKAGYARFGIAGIYRDLAYVLRNQPSFVPFEAIPTSGVKTQAEMFFAASADYYIESLHLRPGIGGGLQVPATFTSTSNVGNATVNHTEVVRQQGSIAILPEDVGRKPIVQARLSLRWDISDIMSAIGWLQLIHDPNTTLITRDPQEGTVLLRTFQSPDFFGFGLTMQARY